MKTMAVLGDPKPGEWLVCRLDGLTSAQADCLGSRPPGIRLAVIVQLPTGDEPLSATAPLLALAWAVAPDAVLLGAHISSEGDLRRQAFVEELQAVAGRGHRHQESPFTHLLTRRQTLLESERQRRDLVESSLSSHLQGVRSYQEQIENHLQKNSSLHRMLLHLGIYQKPQL